MNAKHLFLAPVLGTAFLTAGCIITLDGSYGSGSSQAASTNVIVISSNTVETVTNDYYFTNVIDTYCTVTLDTPSDGQYVDGEFAVTGSADCPGALSKVVLFFESSDGASVSAAYGTVNNKTFSSSVGVSREGTYTVWAAVWDVYGSIGKSDPVTVYADWTPPVVNVASPESSEMILRADGGTATLAISGTATDSVSGVAEIYIQIDSLVYSTGTCEAGSWSYSATLDTGIHTVKIYAEDNAGHLSTTKTYTVTVAASNVQ